MPSEVTNQIRIRTLDILVLDGQSLSDALANVRTFREYRVFNVDACAYA